MVCNVCISWSGGKDSCLAYDRLLYNGAYRIAGLITSYNSETCKVNLHNTPIELIRKQAESIGVELFEIPLSPNASNNEYEMKHGMLFEVLKDKGINHIAYGDIFLEHIKDYRNKLAEKTGMNFIYPLWGIDSPDLAMEFINRGFHSVITAINSEVLDVNMLGKEFNEEFISLLPAKVDVCGENGEFHSFVYDGPFFSESIDLVQGKVTEADYRPAVDMRMNFIDLAIRPTQS